MTQPDVLPDSRLKVKRGTVMCDWPLPGGGSVRVECEPCFCAQCGAAGPYVPLENCHFAFWLCQRCYDTAGAVAGTMVMPDEAFWKTVEQEMLDRYGRPLTAAELSQLAERGWGPLASLVKDSPVRV